MVKSQKFFFGGVLCTTFVGTLYNMKRFHDNTVFQIVDSSNVTFVYNFIIAVLCSYQRCVTLRYCKEVIRHAGLENSVPQ